LTKANGYITGIYNYCDYWCERCAFTKRCRNYMTDRELELEMAAADAIKPEPDDVTNADFWNHIARKVHETAAFGKAEDWHNSIPDEDDFEIDPAWQAREEATSAAVRSHPLVRLAYAFHRGLAAVARNPFGTRGFHSRVAGAIGPYAAGRPRRPARRKSLLPPRLRRRTARG